MVNAVWCKYIIHQKFQSPFHINGPLIITTFAILFHGMGYFFCFYKMVFKIRVFRDFIVTQEAIRFNWILSFTFRNVSFTFRNVGFCIQIPFSTFYMTTSPETTYMSSFLKVTALLIPSAPFPVSVTDFSFPIEYKTYVTSHFTPNKNILFANYS